MERRVVSNPLGGSFHTQLVALVMAISVLSVAVLAGISINTNQQVLKKDVAQRLNVMVSDKMQAMKNLWTLRLEQAESMASDDRIKSFLVGQPAADSNIKDRLTEFVNLTRGKDSTYVEVRVADETGRVLFSTNSAAASDGGHIRKDIFERAVYGPFYTIDFDSNRGIAVLVAVAPVFGSEEASPAGFVVLLRDLNLVNRMLADRLFLGETGEMYLVNNSGLMITGSRFVEGARNSQIVDDIPPVQECFRNGADVNGALYQNYRETTVFGASYCDRNLGIVLVSETASAELFAPLLSLQYQYVTVTSVIIAAAGATSFFLSLSILKPLQKLRTTMSVVQGGRFEKTDIARRDEIGDLAASFNTMVEEIGIRSKRLKLKNDILSFMSSRLEVQSDELKKADKEKEEFSIMISHELKTFLVPVIGYSELLLDGTLGEINSGQKDKVKVILERAWSLLYLTQNILDARQLESGNIRMNMSKISSQSLVQECISRSTPLAKSKDMVMQSSSAQDVELWCDPLRIAQVLDNLVSNAIKAVPADWPNRLIKVSACGHDHGHALFSVQDSGTGIQEEKRQHIFKKFYQVDKSLTRPAGGTGLGLAISKGIVEAHGGKMWFESKPGSGSTFYFSLPVMSESPL